MWPTHKIGQSRIEYTVSIIQLRMNSRGAAEPAAKLRVQQDVDRARDLRREPHHQHANEQRHAGVRTNEAPRRIGECDGQRAEHKQSDPGRRADEHQDRQRQLVAADRLQAGKEQKPPILHVALAPAQVAADEFDQGRRILLPAQIFLRQHPYVVAGGAHQRRFDLIVAEDVADPPFRSSTEPEARNAR